MTEPLGSEFIAIHADASAFRAEVEAQVGAAMAAVRTQVASTPIAAPTVAAGRETATRSGIILPGLVRDSEALAAAQQKVSTATATTTTAVQKQGQAQARAAPAMRNLTKAVQDQERSLGRATRGLVAANAAATGIFRAVTFASGAFLAGAVAGGALAAAMQELSESTRLAAQTQALIEATGGAAGVTADQVDQLATSLLHLTGVDDEVIKQGANVLLTFKNIANAGEGMNAVFDRAVKATLDISGVLGTNLRSTAVQVGKALQDPIRGVTALRRSGISLSQSQRDLVKAMVESGRLLSAQKLILREIEGQIGGTAEAVGQTLVGQFNRMKQEAANALGEMLLRVTQSKDATELAAQASAVLRAAWEGLQRVAALLGPSVIGVARGLGEVTERIGGAATVLALAAAYKATQIAVRGAIAVKAVYTAATATAATATLAEAAAAGTATAALEAQAVAEAQAAAAAQKTLAVMASLAAVVAVGAAVSGNYTVAIVAATAALAAFAVRLIAIRRAMIAATGAATLAQVAFAGAGGALGLAAIGVAAAVGGLLFLRNRMENAAGTANAFSGALDNLSAAVTAVRQGQEKLAGFQEAYSEAVLDARDATAALEVAQRRLAESQAEPGSVRQQALAERVAEAEQRLAAAVDARHVAQSRIASQTFRNQTLEASRRAEVERTTKAIREQIEATRNRPIIEEGLFGIPRITFGGARSPGQQVEAFRDAMLELAESGDVVKARVAQVLSGLRETLDRLPTQREVNVVLRFVAEGQTSRQIFDMLNIAERNRAEELRFRNELQRFDRPGVSAIQEQEKALEQMLAAQKEIVAEKQKTFNAARNETIQAQRNLAVAKETLRTARQALVDARQALADTIKSSQDAITDAVNSAKQNLRSIADSVAEALGRIAGEGGAISPALAARFRELREQARLGLGGPETRRAAQQIEALAAAQRGGEDVDRIRRQFADLSNALAQGRITLPQFNQRLSKLLRDLKFDPQRFAAQFGSAARDEIVALIAGLRAQAGEIVRGPRRPGGGLAPDIVSPSAAVQQASRDITAAQKAVQERVRDVKLAIAERDRRQTEYERLDKIEQRLHTGLLKSIDRRIRISNRLTRAQNRPGNRPKPTGNGARDSQIVTEPYPR